MTEGAKESNADRIANPWGERTPYSPGEPWPMRVDQFLEEGVPEEDVDRWVQTASVMSSNGDALDIAVKDGRIVGVRGRGVDRVNHGRLGPKNLYGWQASASKDRLTRPMVRKDGELVETDWDEAMERIVERSREQLREKGPLSLGFYTTGQIFLEEYYTLGVIGKAGLSTPHMDGNTRTCTATAAAAMKESFGTDGQPGSYTDVDHASATTRASPTISCAAAPASSGRATASTRRGPSVSTATVTSSEPRWNRPRPTATTCLPAAASPSRSSWR